MSAIMVGAMLVPATAADDNGKEFAEGAFHRLGTGGSVIAFGSASHAQPKSDDHLRRVLLFGYEGGPSEGRVFCGDVWNVIVTVPRVLPGTDLDFVDEIFVTQKLDNVVVGPTDETAVRWSSTIGTFTKAHGTFLAPGTLTNGWHEAKQTVGHPDLGIFWDPPPLVFLVDDSAC